MTRRTRLLAFASILSAALAAPVAVEAEPVTIRLVQTNDIDRMEEKDGRGGFAKLASVVAAERARGPTLFVHAGDTLSPSLLSGIDKGAHIIDILNRMGVDAMVPGNHEFDFGPEVFQARISEAKFPIVSSNVTMPGGGGPANTTVDRIVEIEGIKFGFYGLTTEETVESSQPGEIAFLDSVETGIDAAEDLRTQGADIVVALVHTPVDVDFELVRAGAADIVMSGHDEHLLAYYNGKTVLTESGSEGERVVVVDLTVDKTEKDGKVSISWEPAFRIVDTRDIAPDPAIAALVKSYDDKLDAELGVVIGTSATPLDSRRATVRQSESTVGNLVADAMRETAGAELAILNGGSIRGDREYEAGTTLTRRDAFAEMPFGNTLAKIEASGADILAAIENGLSEYEIAGGRFPQISGMTVRADPDKPVGERVLELKVGGEPIDPGRIYIAAITDFIVGGGDGYDMLADDKVLMGAADGPLLATVLIDYIAAKGAVAPTVEGRMVFE